MPSAKKPMTPVKPVGVELIYLYPCPACHREVPVIAPTKPAMAQCDVCRAKFPIVPIDERAMRFVKIMLGNGKAAIDPDFL